LVRATILQWGTEEQKKDSTGFSRLRALVQGFSELQLRNPTGIAETTVCSMGDE